MEPKEKKGDVSLTVAIVFLVAAALFLLAAILVFEYGSTTGPNGDQVVGWYFWLLLALSFLCFFVIIIVYILMPNVKVPASVSSSIDSASSSISSGISSSSAYISSGMSNFSNSVSTTAGEAKDYIVKNISSLTSSSVSTTPSEPYMGLSSLSR
jgi:hypothetical protein